MALNILIVDDSLTVRSVIKKTLKIADIPYNEIHEAENGKQALEVLSENWIDLVFADINMPVMTGVEMVEKMAEDSMLDNIPVVVVSTEGSTTRIEELKNLGIRAYIRKPFAPEALKEVVDQVIGEIDG